MGFGSDLVVRQEGFLFLSGSDTGLLFGCEGRKRREVDVVCGLLRKGHEFSAGGTDKVLQGKKQRCPLSRCRVRKLAELNGSEL